MQIDTTRGSLDGEARRHLQTLNRRRRWVILPLLLGVVLAFLTGRGGEEIFVTQSVVRVPDPTQSSVFSANQSETSSSETERIIASAIQLIQGNDVETLVREELTDARFEEIDLIEITSLEDTLFITIRIGSSDPQIAFEASSIYAEKYRDIQGELDIRDLTQRAAQLRESANLIDQVLEDIDTDLEQKERDIVIRDFQIRALEPQLEEGRVPDALVERTIERNDFLREKDIQLGERGRRSTEQTFLRQEASNLDIEASYRQQTGAQIVGNPEAPVVLQDRNLIRDVIVFALLGALLGVAAALMMEYFDSRIKSMQDLHDMAPDVPVVGAIPKVGSVMNQPHLAVSKGSPWYAAEAYRALRTTLLAVHGRERNGFVISSVGAGAGKSVTVTNLAVSMAQMGFKVLVIDANLRRPSIHMKLGVENQLGLSRLIGEGTDYGAAIEQSPLAEQLHVIPAGPVPDNPAEMLGSAVMEGLIMWSAKRYDWVLVDTPPLDVFTDAAVLAHQAEGVLVVVRFEETDRRRLAEVLDQLKVGGVPLLGFIVNGRDPDQSRANRYARGIGIRNLKTLWTDRPWAQGSKNTAAPSENGHVEEDKELVEAGSSILQDIK